MSRSAPAGAARPSSDRPVRRELGALVRLALPVMLVQVGMVSMGTVDAMMLGRVSERDLAAGALGHSLGFGLVALAMGMLMAIDPLVSQAFGGKRLRDVATHMRRGVILALFLAMPLALIMWDVRPALVLLKQQPVLIEPVAAYCRAMIPGTFAFLLFVAVRQSLQAMSVVLPAVVAIIAANLMNLLGNYALIFGNLGFPAMGVQGSGYATSLARITMLLVLLAASWRTLLPFLRRFRRPATVGSYSHMLRLGFPIGLQVSLEIWMFMTVSLLMGQLGESELAGHQVAIQLAALAFMVPMGIAGAATTRVGQAVGRGSHAGATRAAAVSLALGGSVMGISALCFTLFPWPLARLFTPEPRVLAMAVLLLPIAGIFQVVDGLQVVGAGVLRGVADTRGPAIIAFFGFWVLGVPLAYVLTFPAGFGPVGLWWGLTGGLSAVAVLLLLRIRRRFASELRAVDSTPASTATA